MSKEDIQIAARTLLSPFLSESGSLLYSSHETLKPGDVYLMGFNPGGTIGNTLDKSIDCLLTNQQNAYLDEKWGDEERNEPGTAPLQKRVRWVLEGLGLDPRNVCASNLLFLRSRDAKSINYALADKFWPIHEAILKLVNPKMIIAFGNSTVSPYGYLHARFGGEEAFTPAGHGTWSLKAFRSNINGLDCFVAGLPHLSRYSPIGKPHVIDWLKRGLK